MGIYTKLVKSTLGFEEKGKNCFHGVYKGYDVTINVTNLFVVNLNFKCDDKTKFEASNIFRQTDTQALTKVYTNDLGIQALVNGFTAKSAMKKVKMKLDATIDYLNKNGAKGVCECTSCESQEELSTIKLNDIYLTMCDQCREKLQVEVDKSNEEFDKLPNNYGKGFLGALLGAVIAAVVWIVLYYIGFISALTAVLGVYLGNIFYVKFGGKPTKIKTFICALVTLVSLVLACVYVYTSFASAMILQEGLEMVPFEYIFSDKELKIGFISDMVMNIFFTLLGVLLIYIETVKKDKNSKISIKK